MTDDPFAPPGDVPPRTQTPPYWAGEPPSPWTQSPWGPPGSGAWSPQQHPPPAGSWPEPAPDLGYGVVLPIDPIESLLLERKRGLWYGLGSLGLAIVIPPAALFGFVTLIFFGMGLLVLLGVAIAVVVAAGFAVTSILKIGNNRVDGVSDALWMMPAFASMALLVYYVLWFAQRAFDHAAR